MPIKKIISEIKKQSLPEEERATNTKIFHGVSGLKKLYQLTLENKKPIFALTAVIPEVDPELLTWLSQNYVQERKKKKIFAKVISPKTKLSEKYCQKDKENYRKTLLIPQKKFPISTEVNIFGSYVALISFKKEELLGVLIESKEIAKTMRVFFDIAWEKALDYQKDWEERI